MKSGKVGGDGVEAPTRLDGQTIDAAEASRMHAALASGEMNIECGPGVLEQLEALGLTREVIREQMMASLRKVLS